MRDWIDRYREEIARHGEADKLNGSFSWHLLIELGDSEFHVARRRLTRAVEVVRCFWRLYLLGIRGLGSSGARTIRPLFNIIDTIPIMNLNGQSFQWQGI